VSRVYEQTPWSNNIASDQMTGKRCKIPKALIELANYATPEEQRNYNISQAVVQLGFYARVSDGAIEDAKVNAKKISYDATSFNIAAVSALLYPLINCTQTQTEIEYAMRNKKPLPKIKDCAPKPTFPCLECGTLNFTAKNAKYHCKKKLYK
tara:strand:- start:329 stop:784 length:456 start_codon:yes stop_codon:yes gene_type:complete